MVEKQEQLVQYTSERLGHHQRQSYLSTTRKEKGFVAKCYMFHCSWIILKFIYKPSSTVSPSYKASLTKAPFLLIRFKMHWNSKIQSKLSKSNLIATSFCVWNGQVFGLYMLNKQRFPTFEFSVMCIQDSRLIHGSVCFFSGRDGRVRVWLLYYLYIHIFIQWNLP